MNKIDELRRDLDDLYEDYYNMEDPHCRKDETLVIADNAATNTLHEAEIQIERLTEKVDKLEGWLKTLLYALDEQGINTDVL